MSCSGARVLLDIGFSCREVSRRLGEIHVDPGTLDAILITHAHGDHTRGVRGLSKRHGVPVYATDAVRGECGATDADWRTLVPEATLALGELRFLPFEVPHDASETLAFRIETPEGVIGYANGYREADAASDRAFSRLPAAGHRIEPAVELLRVSPYARSTRERIGGDDGHL